MIVDLVTYTPDPDATVHACSKISRVDGSIADMRAGDILQPEASARAVRKITQGLGHHSVAEHASFTFQISGLSRLAVEWLESGRLQSYTEKSFRYQKLESGDDFIRPFNATAKVDSFYDRCFTLYQELLAAGVNGEDARYVLPLAIPTTLAYTANARSLNHTILKLKASGLPECVTLSCYLARIAGSVAPGLIPLVNADKQLRQMKIALYQTFEVPPNCPDVFLVDHMGGFSKGSGTTMTLSRDVLPGRMWETEVYSYIVTVSASAFAQLKRHRMMTLVPGPYDPNLGYYLPQALIPFSTVIRELVNSADCLGLDHYEKDYLTLHVAKRRVFLVFNLRQLHAMALLRLDKHAQAEIRKLMERLVEDHISFDSGFPSILVGRHELAEEEEV